MSNTGITPVVCSDRNHIHLFFIYVFVDQDLIIIPSETNQCTDLNQRRFKTFPADFFSKFQKLQRNMVREADPTFASQ